MVSFDDINNPEYWCDQIRNTVLFSDSLNLLLNDKNSIFIEVGPGRSLSSFVSQHENKKSSQKVLNLIRHPKEDISDQYYLFNKIGELWLNGIVPSWGDIYENEDRRKVSLPTYSFEKNKYEAEFDLKKILTLNSFINNQEINKSNDGNLVNENEVQIIKERPEFDIAYQEPTTDIEKELAIIWKNFFGLDKIGIEDDFFELGGDSLKATSLLSLVHEKFDVIIPMAEVFKCPTIKEMSLFIEMVDLDKNNQGDGEAINEERERFEL
jgi:acyl carrier protein